MQFTGLSVAARDVVNGGGSCDRADAGDVVAGGREEAPSAARRRRWPWRMQSIGPAEAARDAWQDLGKEREVGVELLGVRARAGAVEADLGQPAGRRGGVELAVVSVLGMALMGNSVSEIVPAN